MTEMWAAAGWVLAAFLGGMLAGRRWAAGGGGGKGRGVRNRRAVRGGKGKAAGAGSETEEEREKAERARREWENFLNYDGTFTE